MKTKVLFGVVLMFLCMHQIAYSLEIRPLIELFAPAKVSVVRDTTGVESEIHWNTDPVFEGGLELLSTAEFSLMRYGLGVAYKSPQQDDDDKATPAAIPVWGVVSFGSVDEVRFFSPYFVVRVGSLLPLTKDGNWWERPLNFFANGGVGAVFPYAVGIEVNYDYSSMLKSYESMNLKYRVSSGRVGIQLSVGFELIRDKVYAPNKK